MIGLVGFAHALSHFFQLALPPLFPLLKAEFDVSWSLLGSLVGVFYAASGASQFTAGFAVDRFGARPVLFGGLALVAGGTVAASLVPSVGWLFPVVALMGVGNGVFHPVDFAILNANVAPRRLGHAYSAHGIGGNLGYALAPIAAFGLASAFGWREALAAMGLAGLAGLGVLVSQRARLTCHVGRGHRPSGASAASLFRQPAILACFAYFAIFTMGTLGLQTFAPATLNVAFDVPLSIATSAVTALLLGSTAGIVAGGFLAARTERHDRVASAGLASAAALTLSLTLVPPPAALLLPLFAVIGFALGSTGPSRDMIVRSATPPGAAGRVYGFVYSGLDFGATLGPVWFGFMLDHGLGKVVFAAAAACFLVAIATVLQVRRVNVARAG
ncbi:Fosmidomycin resistance protein [Rhizobiaceae bacterium]|nr:Fosmidomycin resistance protein [Rhizobiaceae bacterium]